MNPKIMSFSTVCTDWRCVKNLRLDYIEEDDEGLG